MCGLDTVTFGGKDRARHESGALIGTPRLHQSGPWQRIVDQVRALQMKSARGLVADLDRQSRCPRLFSTAAFHCETYCGFWYGSNAAKLVTVVPSTAGAKLKLVIDGTKASLWFVSGKMMGALWSMLHHVFISIGV